MGRPDSSRRPRPMRQWGALGMAAGVLAWASLPTGCGSGDAGSSAAPSVVFISIDTLRADHVGCYGHPGQATPKIDRLAREGTRFEVCVSSCPLTLPSHSTMMTGTYPFVHGARNNGTFVLDGENRTLAEALRDAGYRTHAEIGAAVLERQYGLDQGFEGYGDAFIDAQIQAREVSDDSLRLQDTQRRATAVTEAGLAYLESRRRDAQPFFLFLHYFDPHQPYEAPAPFAERHGGGYLSEIAYTDHEVGRVLDLLREPDFAERTVVVLTSDHGDSFSEHREFSHGSFLYDTTLRVPLVLWGPGHIPAGQVVGAQAGLVDLFPTLLELTGTPQADGVQGASLVPLLDDPDGDLHRETYAETLETRMTFGYSELRALVQDGWKYIHGPRPELYEVARDPEEGSDRVAEAPAKAQEMRAAMRELIAGAPELLGRGTVNELGDEDVQRLAALGYATEEGEEDPDDPHLWRDELSHFDSPRGENPVDRARDIYYLYLGLGALRDGNHEGGVKHWSAFVERNPDYAPAHSYLGQCLASLGKSAEAIASFRRAVELKGDRCDDRQMLGALLADAGRLVEARTELEGALECNPDHPVAGLHYGKLLLLQGEPAEAARVLEHVLEIVPGNPTVGLLLARAQVAADRYTPAIETLRALIDAHPEDPTAYLELGALLARQGTDDEASAFYTQSLQRFPGHVPLRVAAARSFMDRGLDARASKVLEAGLRAKPGHPGLEAARIQLLATASDPALRDPSRADELARQLLASGHGEDPRLLGAAAAAAAALGDRPRAIELVERALPLATERGATDLRARLASELAAYRSR